MEYQGFIGGAYRTRSPNQATDTCVNLYLELTESGTGKSEATLYGTPGLRRFTTLPAPGACRGAYTTAGGRAFVVCGYGLYEVFSGGTFRLRGMLRSFAGTVSMADNGLELLCVDGTDQGYLLTLASNAYARVASPGFSGGDVVVSLDGYFVLNRPGTGQFYVSGLLAGGVYDATEFASAEGRPDQIVSLIADHRELLVFGTKSTQPFFNSGNVDFPFEPLQGTLVEQGIAATHSAASMDNTTYWLGADTRGMGMVWKLAGYTPQRCSTHAIEYAINQYARIDDAVAYTYQEEGHAFYVLSFPTGNATWVYDAATQLWHQRASLDPLTGQWQRHAAQYHCSAFGLHLVCGDGDERVYSAELGQSTDDGMALVRERTAPVLADNERLLYHSVLELDLECGVGLDGGVIPGTSPQVMLQWSDDGGHTWSQERWVTAGPQGQYDLRALWRRLGRSRARAYRVRISDPVKVALIGARIEVA